LLFKCSCFVRRFFLTLLTLGIPSTPPPNPSPRLFYCMVSPPPHVPTIAREGLFEFKELPPFDFYLPPQFTVCSQAALCCPRRSFFFSSPQADVPTPQLIRRPLPTCWGLLSLQLSSPSQICGEWTNCHDSTHCPYFFCSRVPFFSVIIVASLCTLSKFADLLFFLILGCSSEEFSPPLTFDRQSPMSLPSPMSIASGRTLGFAPSSFTFPPQKFWRAPLLLNCSPLFLDADELPPPAANSNGGCWAHRLSPSPARSTFVIRYLSCPPGFDVPPPTQPGTSVHFFTSPDNAGHLLSFRLNIFSLFGGPPCFPPQVWQSPLCT